MKKTTATLMAWILVGGASLFAQSNTTPFYERFKFDVGGFALAPQSEPAQIGGGASIGYALKSIDIYARIAYLNSDSGLNAIMLPNLLLDYRLPLLTNFFTATPYVAAGVWYGKIKNSVTHAYGSTPLGTMYLETGMGGELLISGELSLFARVGVGYALAETTTDSLNSSGLTLTGGLRYSFGSRTTPNY
ncbi:MAG TPA: hypothetical protein PLY93_11430 [Turneriella sp.]|nr:hypothetical protein [Turneriella sp.]